MKRLKGIGSCTAAALAALLAANLFVTPTRATNSPPEAIHQSTSTILSGVNLRQQTRVRRPGVQASVITGPMVYGGGPVQTAPAVYVVYWGWGSDPYGEQAYLNDFLQTIGGTSWLQTVTQYSNAGNPSNLYVASWSDPSPIPQQPSDAQIQAEALAAANYFGLGTSVNIQIVVATPTGHSSPGFGTQSGWCAYHGALAAKPNITYTNFPYQTDAGSLCGMNAVSGPLDGVSIVEGHELAESITDPIPSSGWADPSQNEIGDKCAWSNLSTVTTSSGTFAVQPLWSNAANGCVLASANLQAPALTDSGNGVACPNDGLEWSSVSGATSYQVWNRELRPGLSPSYSEIWSGSAQSLGIKLSPNWTISYTVEACNASGCSAFSKPVAVRYGNCL